MKLHWLRDYVNKKQFKVTWGKGATNQADYFTKHHPTIHHRRQRPHFIHDSFNILKEKINMIYSCRHHNTERVC